MKRPLSEAAAALGLHPTNLCLYLGQLGIPPRDAWPDVDDEWLDAVRSMDWARFGKTLTRGEMPTGTGSETVTRRELGLTPEASQILEKLWRQGRWGDLTVSIETIKKHYSRPNADADAAVGELVDRGIVVAHGPRGPFSLNPARTAEIEKLGRILVAPRLGQE